MDITFKKTQEMDFERSDRQAEEFIKKLKEQGHTCIIEIETFPVTVDWCEKEVCLGYDFRERASEKSLQEKKELKLKLKEEGHSCIKEYESGNFKWCENNSECTETRKLIEKLKKQNHTCIKDETKPLWCKQPVCIFS